MATMMHVSLSVRGYLIGPDKDCRDLFKREGRTLTPLEAKVVLAEYLAQGHEVLPFGEPCEGWDKVNGCPGHPVAETQPLKAELPPSPIADESLCSSCEQELWCPLAYGKGCLAIQAN
jgi:hypothetical protein